jgi:hypothetical protein
MKLRGQVTEIRKPFGKKPTITLEVSADPAELEQFQGMDLDISLAKHREKRSKDANACLWACLGDIAEALHTDNWSVYLYMLERYGQFEYVLVVPEAVERLKKVWRTISIPDNTVVDGMIGVQCFFGSSTYNTKEFSRLLDGVISEMKEMHIPTPPSEEMQAMIEEMGKKERDKARRQEKARQSCEK